MSFCLISLWIYGGCALDFLESCKILKILNYPFKLNLKNKYTSRSQQSGIQLTISSFKRFFESFGLSSHIRPLFHPSIHMLPISK